MFTRKYYKLSFLIKFMKFNNYLKVATLVILGYLSSKNLISNKERDAGSVPVTIKELEPNITKRILFSNYNPKELMEFYGYALEVTGAGAKIDSLRNNIASFAFKKSVDFARKTASIEEHNDVLNSLNSEQDKIQDIKKNYGVLIPKELYLTNFRQENINGNLSAGARNLEKMIERITPEDALTIKWGSEVSKIPLNQIISIYLNESSLREYAVSVIGATGTSQQNIRYADDIYRITTNIGNKLSDCIKANTTPETFAHDLVTNRKLNIVVGINHMLYYKDKFNEEEKWVTINNIGLTGTKVAYKLLPKNSRFYDLLDTAKIRKSAEAYYNKFLKSREIFDELTITQQGIEE